MCGAISSRKRRGARCLTRIAFFSTCPPRKYAAPHCNALGARQRSRIAARFCAGAASLRARRQSGARSRARELGFHGLQSGGCERLGYARAEFSFQQAITLCAGLERSAKIVGAAFRVGWPKLETRREKPRAQRFRGVSARKMGPRLARRLGHRNAKNFARSQTPILYFRPRKARRFARPARLAAR